MAEIENDPGETFSDRIGYILLEKISEQQKCTDIENLFLCSKSSLVASVVRGDTTFCEVFEPLLQEYGKLTPASLLTDTCMNEEFMQKANELNQKVSGVISPGLNMVLGSTVRYCDITSPFSRATLAKKAYETNRMSINIFMVSLLFYLFSPMLLDMSDFLVVNFLNTLNNFLLSYFIIIVTMFLFSCYLNYLAEYRLRKESCAILCMQATRLDDIAKNLFFRSK